MIPDDPTRRTLADKIRAAGAGTTTAGNKTVIPGGAGASSIPVVRAQAPTGIAAAIRGARPAAAPVPASGPAQDSMAKSPSNLMPRQTPRPFNAPVQNQLGTSQFTNLGPRNPAAPAAVPGAPAAAPAAAPSLASRIRGTGGYAAYTDEKLGGAGFRKSGGDRKAGWVAQSGAYRGKTRDEAEQDLRRQYAAMSPEQRAAYEARARNEDIGDQTPTSDGAAPSMPSIPSAPAPAMSPSGAMGAEPIRKRANFSPIPTTSNDWSPDDEDLMDDY